MDKKNEMDKKEKGILENIAGLQPVNPADLAEFKRAMSEEVIPEILRVIDERRLQAAKSRHWQLKC